MIISELLAYTKEDLEQAQLCSNEIVDILNKYDLKALLVKAFLIQIIGAADKEIERLIRENNGKEEINQKG